MILLGCCKKEKIGRAGAWETGFLLPWIDPQSLNRHKEKKKDHDTQKAANIFTETNRTAKYKKVWVNKPFIIPHQNKIPKYPNIIPYENKSTR